MNPDKTINRLIFKLKRIAFHIVFRRKFRKLLNKTGLKNKPVDGEKLYLKKWHRLSQLVEPYSYRFFSHYCGITPDIIPEDIGDYYIQSILSPRRYRPFYRDKNLYYTYLPSEILPKMFCCRINGGPILNDKFEPFDSASLLNCINNETKILLKPSNDSCSGTGVMIFNKTQTGDWVNHNGDKLSVDYLMQYGDDFILQEVLKQHDQLSLLCKTSVNTLRIATYRSVKNDEIYVTAATLRIGRNGSICDNACAGGVFTGIDVRTGQLGKYVCNKDGVRQPKWNAVDFTQNNYIIPNWENVIEFAKSIAKANKHCRALGLDVCIDHKGDCKLIEYNVDFFGYWIFMYTGQKVFGDKLDEIIDYCVNNKHLIYK